MEQAKKDFPEFLNRALSENPLKAEYFLPSIVSRMIDEQGTGVQVLRSTDRWYGVTYPQDKQTVVQALARMTEQGLYPEPLWQK